MYVEVVCYCLLKMTLNLFQPAKITSVQNISTKVQNMSKLNS